MKYLLFDQSAIATFISTSSLQSVEYSQGDRFFDHLTGKLSSETFEGVAIEYTPDGIIFCGKKNTSSETTSKGHHIFCIDLTTCNIMDEANHPSDFLTVIQKTLRTTYKIWEKQPFSYSERIHKSKSIIFPFVLSDRRRMVIERSNHVPRLTKRGVDTPLLAYKYNAEDAPSTEEIVDTKILLLAGEDYVAQYNALQLKLKESVVDISKSDSTTALAHITSTSEVGRDDFIFRDYAHQLSMLTKAQQYIVNYRSLDVPLRVDGAAGTGKTLSLLLRAYRLLMEHKETNTPFNVVFFAHSSSTCQRNKEIFSLYPDSAYFLDINASQHIEFTTLLDYCINVARFSPDTIIEKDANDAKTYQLMLIEHVITKAIENHTIQTYRPLLSSELYDLFDTKKTASQVLYSILQHEFSIQIKGRTDCTIYTYYDIPSIPNALPCITKTDKEFIFLLFNEYQHNLKNMGSFDVDDVIMEALAHLNAPIWRRERTKNGFDYIFADEMHLFNINEQSVFHYLTKNQSQENIPICFALDYSQAIGDRGNVKADYIEKAFGNAVEQQYNTVFRNSPQIAEFCASIAASGTLMFQETFSNPYKTMQSSFTSQEEDVSTIPALHMYNNDEEMLKSISLHLQEIIKNLQCKPSEIAVISFDPNLLTDEGVELLKNTTKKAFVRLGSNDGPTANAYTLASPYSINGLEFKAVILVGVDEGRLPQTAGTSDISQHFIKYSAYNLLYLSSSRAKYRLVILGSKLNGYSTCLEHTLCSNHLTAQEH